MVLRKFSNLCKNRPLLMNMVTFGTMYVSAATTQQILQMYLPPFKKKKFDWSLPVKFGTIGITATGPFLFVWYRCVDRFLPVVTKRLVLTKLTLDAVVCMPMILVLFFTGMSLLEGKEDIFAELKAKFLQTYTMSCCFWLPAQAINFCFLPPYTRVAFVGCASFVWVNVLCLIKRREVPGVTTSVEIPAAVKES